MNKKTLYIIISIVIILIIVGIPVAAYNSVLSEQADVEEEMADIDTQLQRRADLIPNLVKTVKAYTSHESNVFREVTDAREAMISANTMSEKSEANDQVTSALNRLIAVAEAYPQLTSDKVYMGLMDELAGTENRISTARIDYNEDVKDYNLAIRRFPKSIIANIFGFRAADYFQSSDNADNVPEVNLTNE